MNFIYGYIQSKVAERIISTSWNIIKNTKIVKSKEHIYNFVADPVWNEELQKYYLGTVYIAMKDPHKVSNDSGSDSDDDGHCVSNGGNYDPKNPHQIG